MGVREDPARKHHTARPRTHTTVPHSAASSVCTDKARQPQGVAGLKAGERRPSDSAGDESSGMPAGGSASTTTHNLSYVPNRASVIWGGLVPSPPPTLLHVKICIQFRVVFDKNTLDTYLKLDILYYKKMMILVTVAVTSMFKHTTERTQMKEALEV